MSEYSRETVFADKYYKQVRQLLAAEGIDSVISINTSRWGTHGNNPMIYINPIPVVGNKELIKKLNQIKGFYGTRKLGYDNRYQYEGYIELEEVQL